jgi:soluble lytic murein transglycosylase
MASRMRIALGWLLLGACLTGGWAWADEARSGIADADRQLVVREAAAGNLGTAADALLGLEAEGAALGPRDDLLLGILLIRLGKSQEAVPRLARAMDDPVLADYALYHLAAAFREAQDRMAAAEAIQRLLDQHPRSVFVERGARELPREWLEAGELSRAEAAAGRYLGRFRSSPGVAAVWVALGETLLSAGRFEAAEQVFRRVWVELPGSPDSERARDWLVVLEASPFTADERYLRAGTLARLGRHAQAVAELGPFAAAGDPREARARLALGTSAFALRQYEQAARWLLPLRDAPGPDRAEALFWLGRSAGRAGDAGRFTDSLTLLADALPAARRAEEALYLLAQSAADEGEPAKGRVYAARLLKQYPQSTWKDAALWLDGWLAFKQQSPKAALAAWARLAAEEPASRFRVPALYWRGRALEASGRSREAGQAYLAAFEAADEQPYYRMRATARLAGLGKKVSRPLARTVSAAAGTGPADRLHAEKARALRGIGLIEEAAEEYREQSTAQPDDREALGEACRAFLDLERYDRALWLAKRLLVPLLVQEKGKIPVRDFWACLYPLGHWDPVTDSAAAGALDPLLVAAVMREESAFGPRVLSSAGARGLMQVMPHTGERIARELGLPVSPGMLDIPEINIRLGTAHLAELARLHGGNPVLVLASYNAGPQPVQRWLERFGFADEEGFVEDIPYAETRNYVKRVLGTYTRYRELYGGSDACGAASGTRAAAGCTTVPAPSRKGAATEAVAPQP